MKKNNKKFVWLVLIIVVVCAVLVYAFFFKKEKAVITEVKVIDNIDKYDYVLYENKTKLYNDNFENLKAVLNSETVDYDEYAKVISKLFVIDFYDLDSKVTNTDIGGLQFIYPTEKDSFVNASKNTMYKYVESNVYGNRKEKLPSVKSVEVTNLKNEKFESEKVSDENAYITTLSIDYVVDLEYPKEVTLTIVHSDNKLYIVEVK